MSRSASQAMLAFDGAAPESPSEPPSVPAYETYRESGIPWLGQVPSHWAVEKLKFIARAQFSNVDKKTEEGEQPVRLCNYVDVYYHDRITADIDFMEATAEPREALKFQLQPGDVLVTKDSEDPHDICVPAVVAEPLPGVLCGYHLAQVRPDPSQLHGPYLMYAFASSGIRDQFRMRANGITRFGLSQDDICSALFPLPPVPEQEAIAAWLDERTRRVDELVAAKRRLIDLLAEQRTALITHAVTKGLDPAAPMRPSGINWLGDLPAHWEVKRLRYLCLIQTGDKDTVDAIDDGEYPFFVRSQTVEHIHSYTFDCEAVLTAGDGVGVGKVFHHYSGKFDVHQRVYVMYRFRRILGRFLYYFLKEQFYKVALEGAAKSTVDSLRRPMFTGFPVSLPPLNEQEVIVAHLDATCAQLDNLTVAAEAAITRLTEYRQAIISAAVTGKIRVCDLVVEAPAAERCAELPTEAPAVVARIGTNGAARMANKHFQRSVLAAEVIARIGNDRTFGRVKLQKALILAEGHLQLAEIASQPVRAAAGPFDNAMMRSIQSQLQKAQWYEYIKDGNPLKFVPLAKAGGHKVYFERYWGAKEAGFAALMALLARLDTRRSEIVATLYSAWNDFLIDGNPVTDDALVAEVLTRWDPAKTAIPEAKWRAALPWMRGQGLVPTGYGAHTKSSVPQGRTS